MSNTHKICVKYTYFLKFWKFMCISRVKNAYDTCISCVEPTYFWGPWLSTANLNFCLSTLDVCRLFPPLSSLDVLGFNEVERWVKHMIFTQKTKVHILSTHKCQRCSPTINRGACLLTCFSRWDARRHYRVPSVSERMRSASRENLEATDLFWKQEPVGAFFDIWEADERG